MPDDSDSKGIETRQDHLREVETLLDKQRLVEELVERQDMHRHELVSGLVHKQHLAELQQRLDVLHPADIAFILESLPLADRLRLWELVKAERDGDILLEVSDAVRETLIADMDRGELLAAAEHLDTDEIADLAPDLPHDVLQELMESLDAQNRARLQSALAYPEESVGALMDFDLPTIRDDVTLEVVLRYLRLRGALPDQTDKLFVIDRQNHLLGILPLRRLLFQEPETLVADALADNPVAFHPDDEAHEAAQAFERYDLVTAPVVDRQGHLVGRLTIDVVVDYIRERSESEMLSMAGLREEEDLFGNTWRSVQNRWTWLAVNLVTAFIASRVIGLFEGSIEKVVALAALMPIIAGIGGNSGNQTITMIVRAIAVGQLRPDATGKLFAKEVGISLVNGVVWGSVVGLFAFLLYQRLDLGLVMALAMLLNLLLAAVMGVAIPVAMNRLGRDPAVGSSVMITAITDSGGFFIFLGLATLFLM